MNEYLPHTLDLGNQYRQLSSQLAILVAMCFYPATTTRMSQNENVGCRPPHAILISVMLKKTTQALKNGQNEGEIKFTVQLAS